MRKRVSLHKSQAILEMAVFATLIFVVLGSMVAYLQTVNDRQFIQQDAFRRALKRSRENNAPVTYNIIEDRRRASVNSPLIGERGSESARAVVNWSVPDIGRGMGTGQDLLYDVGAVFLDNLSGMVDVNLPGLGGLLSGGGSTAGRSYTYYKINEDEFHITNLVGETGGEAGGIFRRVVNYVRRIDGIDKEAITDIKNVHRITTSEGSTIAKQQLVLNEQIQYTLKGSDLPIVGINLSPDRQIIQCLKRNSDGSYSYSVDNCQIEDLSVRKARGWDTPHE